jgi:carotenoid cleavage dioxygenase-like enzyme
LKKIQEQPWRGGLEPVDGTVGIPLHDAKVVEGKVPSDLTGMLCRNGPGRIRIGSSQYGHWFDGDGFVTQLALDGRLQRATFQGRYVETDRFVLQKKVTAQYLSSLDYYDDYTDKRTIPFARSGVWTKAGTGGRFENLFKIPTNPANTNVIFLDPNNKDRQQTPKLYAIAEGGDPVQLDTETLKTIGSSKIQNKDRTKVSKSFFSAHYKVDPKTKEIFNHGMSLAFQTAVNVMRLSPSGELLQQSSIALPSLCFIHDNALSENYFVLILPPYTINRSSLLESLLGGEPFGKKFRWNNEGRKEHNHTMAMVFSKKTLECVAQIPLELLSTYHLIDAFEEHDSSTDTTLLSVRLLVHGPPPSERIQVEECFSDLYRSGPLPLCQIMQYTMDVQRATVTYSRQVAPDARPCELPDANQSWGYKKRFLYTNVREDRASFTNSIQKVDMETGKCSDVVSFGDGTYAGAPIFLPTEPAGEDEDDGYILTQVYRSYEHRSDIAILDAKMMKVVTLLQLDTHIPYQFHGAWYPTR